jgi:hypothetical protein
MDREQYNWTNEAVIGLSLLITGGRIDSFGHLIDENIFYEVGKRKSDGMVAILPTGRNMKHEFLNDVMKHINKFN